MGNNSAEAVWRIPGFTYDQINRAGYPSLNSLIRVSESTRNLRSRFPAWMPVSEHAGEPHIVPIMFAQHMEVSLPLYERSACDFPLIVKASLLEIGRTSMVLQDTFYEESTGDLMLKLWKKLVYTDLTTRRPSPWPQSFLDQRKAFIVEKGQEKFQDVSPLVLPAAHYSTEIRITHSEMDQMFHTNQSNYLKYSMDCASEAAEAGFFKDFTEDLCFYHGKSVSVIHRGESFVGDRLKVCTWQDPEDVNILYFVIKKGDKNIYYATVTMFPSFTSKL